MDAQWRKILVGRAVHQYDFNLHNSPLNVHYVEKRQVTELEGLIDIFDFICSN